MCGIAGVIAFEAGHATPEVARVMASAISHRGPDGTKVHCGRAPLGEAGREAVYALAHTRLAVIDTSARAAQPMCNEDGSVWLVFNGEIYNHRRLRRELEARGHRFRSECDAEVVLHLFEEEGSELCERLHGMYAFCVLDTRQGRAIFARDPAGQKPLVFAKTTCGGLLFASEPRALLAAEHAGGPGLDRSLDTIEVDRFLCAGYSVGERSALSAVRRLLPGEVCVYERGRLRRGRASRFGLSPALGGETRGEAWRDAPERGVLAVPRGGPLVRRVRDTLTAAVHARLESDVPLGSFLSGGVDSTIVTAIAARALGRPLTTFSIGFDEPRWDESAYAELAARAIGTTHRTERLGDEAALAIPEIVWAHGEPFADESAIAVHHLARLARREVTVVLTGDGGDELYLGYRHQRLARALRVFDRVTPSLLRRGLSRLGPGRGDARSLRDKLSRLVTSLGDDEAARYVAWSGLYHGGPGATTFAEAVRTAGTVERYDLASYLPGDLLAKVDRATMAWGLEARSPFLDRRVAALAATLPARSKAPAPWVGKAILKRAFRHVLPKEIVHRKKMGFGVPLAVWLRRDPLRSLVRDTLGSAPARSRSWREGLPIEEWLDEHQKGRRDHARSIYAALTLDLFALQFLDSKTPTPVRWATPA
ncbi:MAG: asparagine synthase (glutamine-hydrolyzing) [Planctomycetota bacterium]